MFIYVYIYIYAGNQESHTPYRVPQQKVCGNSCTWALNKQVHKLSQSYFSSHWLLRQMDFIISYIYCAHIASARLKHFVCHVNLWPHVCNISKKPYIYIYICTIYIINIIYICKCRTDLKKTYMSVPKCAGCHKSINTWEHVRSIDT